MWRWYFSITWIVKCSVWKGVIVCLFRMIVKERFMLWRVEECKTWYRVYISNSNSDSNSTSSNVIVPLQYELWRVQCEKVVWGWYHRPRVTFQLSTSIWHLSKGSRSLNIGKKRDANKKNRKKDLTKYEKKSSWKWKQIQNAKWAQESDPPSVGAGTIEAIRSVTCDDVTLHFAFEKHYIILRFRFVV